MNKKGFKLMSVIAALALTLGTFINAQALVVSAANPCIGAPAPNSWKVVVFVLENRTRSQVIGNSAAPYISSLATKCGSSLVWNDANKKVSGSADGNYNSKPSYAVMTNGISPSVSGILNDTYSTKTSAYSIYDQMLSGGVSFKDYYGSTTAGGCGVRWNGDYHDAIRYYPSVASVCNAHDAPIGQFMTDVNAGNLPQFSLILPNSSNSMHDNSTSSGDTYTKNFIDPLLNSAEYKSGHVALFIIFDEEIPVPNVLIAPSVVSGSLYKPKAGNNPVSHFSALRTWEEMLGLPLIGDTAKSPSLLAFFGGSGSVPTTNTVTPVPSTSTNTPTPTNTPAPTLVSTYTPTPTNTSMPTLVSTYTPTPTNTPAPTLVSTDTPTPTNTPAPTLVSTDTPTPASHTPIFSNGFETGDLSTWTTSGGLTAQSALAHEGIYAVQGNTTDGRTYAKKALPTTYSDGYARIYFNLVSYASQVNLLRYRTSADVSMAYLFVNTTGKLSLQNDIASATVISTTTVGSGWHALEFHVISNGASSTTEVWLDGVKVNDLSITTNLGANLIGRLQIGEVQSGRTYNVIFDNVVFDNQYIGL